MINFCPRFRPKNSTILSEVKYILSPLREFVHYFMHYDAHILHLIIPYNNVKIPKIWGIENQQFFFSCSLYMCRRYKMHYHHHIFLAFEWRCINHDWDMKSNRNRFLYFLWLSSYFDLLSLFHFESIFCSRTTSVLLWESKFN